MSETPRLLVIDPSVRDRETQGVAEVVHGWPGEHRLVEPALDPASGPGPGDGYDVDGIVLLGSAASVYDDLDWVCRLSAWIRPVLEGEERVPLLAVCFGHQLVAHLAGAAIGFVHDDHTRVRGVEESTLSSSRLLPGTRSLRVVVSHREEVKEVPDGYRLVASRPLSPKDGLEHVERPIFAYQFHPEARDEFANRRGIGAGRIDARLRADGRRLITAFHRTCL